MCVVSNMGDMGREMWPGPWDRPKPVPMPKVDPWKTVPYVTPPPYNGPTKEQFEEFLDLIRAARKFDKATGQEDCPAKDKTDWMNALAKHLGVDRKKVEEALA